MKKQDNKKDKVLILIWPIIAAILSFLFKANFFVSTIIFFGLPAIYLSFKNKNLIKKSAFFAVLFGLPLTIVIDYVLSISNTWFIPKSVFPVRLFGVVTIDMLLWGFLYLYFIVMYYEYFLEHKFKDKLYYPNMKYLIIGSFGLLFALLTIIILNPALLNVQYFYLKVGLILGIIPIISVLLKFPNLVTKFLKTGAYFFYLSFIYEITAVKLGQWTFPGNSFIGWVTIFGANFPLEELLFWIILCAISVLSYYEFFDDDRK